MTKINFTNKKFKLLENSKNGAADSKTIFEYAQKEDVVTANYQGGAIRTGNIIARLEGRQLYMIYQCLTVDNELKSGKATADITFTEDNKMKLLLHWEWLKTSGHSGKSEYIEI